VKINSAVILLLLRK